MILTNEEADAWMPDLPNTGRPPDTGGHHPAFVQGGLLVTGPHWAASVTEVPVPTIPPRAPTRHPGTPLRGDHALPPSPMRAPPPQRRRLDEEGDAVPGSQDSILAERVRTLAIGTTRQLRSRSLSSNSLLKCRMCPAADAFQARDSRGLLQHMVRMHLGQELPPEAVEQLRNLNKGMCVICAGIRACTVPFCSHCGIATPMREPRVGDIVPDRRRGDNPQPATQTPSADGVGQPAPSQDEEEDNTPASDLFRDVRLPANFDNDAKQLSVPPLMRTPLSVCERFASAWTKALEGCMADHPAWSVLARFRCKLLKGPVPRGEDRVDEIKKRLHLWERGEFRELLDRLLGQQSELHRKSGLKDVGMDDEERLAKATKSKAIAGAPGKAIKGLVLGVEQGTVEMRRSWACDLIPRAERPTSTSEAEMLSARLASWGAGDFQQGRRQMHQACKTSDGRPQLPWVRLPPLSAPGPSGERAEDLEDIMNSTCVGAKRKMRRALDKLTVRWAQGSLPATCRWLLNTRVLFLRKDRDAAD